MARRMGTFKENGDIQGEWQQLIILKTNKVRQMMKTVKSDNQPVVLEMATATVTETVTLTNKWEHSWQQKCQEEYSNILSLPNCHCHCCACLSSP